MNGRLRYLLDTDWAAALLRGYPTGVIQKYHSFDPSTIAISRVTVVELYSGIFRAKDQAKAESALLKLINSHFILEIDEAVSRQFGQIHASLKDTPIGDFDTLIGAIAKVHNLTILTQNIRHFEKIKGLKVFSI